MLATKTVLRFHKHATHNLRNLHGGLHFTTTRNPRQQETRIINQPFLLPRHAKANNSTNTKDIDEIVGQWSTEASFIFGAIGLLYAFYRTKLQTQTPVAIDIDTKEKSVKYTYEPYPLYGVASLSALLSGISAKLIAKSCFAGSKLLSPMLLSTQILSSLQFGTLTVVSIYFCVSVVKEAADIFSVDKSNLVNPNRLALMGPIAAKILLMGIFDVPRLLPFTCLAAFVSIRRLLYLVK